MDKPLNICLISREYPPDTAFGGIATFSRDTALMLSRRGHRVTVLSQSLSANTEFEDEGVMVVKIRVPRLFSGLRFLPPFVLAFNCLIVREVVRRHRRTPFDLIDAPDHLAEGLFASFTGIPMVTRLHTPYALLMAMGLNNYRKGLSFGIMKALEGLAIRRSAVLYAPCRDLVRRCDELFGLTSIPQKIFGYPLDLDLFSPLSNGIRRAGRRILFLGRLEHRKGIETMAEAFPKVVRSMPDATLTLVGNDTPNITGATSARAYMEGRFYRAGCLPNVKFVKPVPLEELPSLLQSHDIVWVPSLYDNYPLVCLEAMACGKVVIVSDAGGLPEMVDHGRTGLVFPAGSAEGLVQNTLKILEDEKLRGSIEREARRYTQVACSVDHVYDRTLEMYRFILDQKGA